MEKRRWMPWHSNNVDKLSPKETTNDLFSKKQKKEGGEINNENRHTL
jgi:hypothetical protein